MRALAVLAMIASLPGCLGIEHHLRGVAMGSEGEAAGLGVSDALVTLLCPDEVSREATTTMGGHFELPLDGSLAAECEVVVSKPGYRAQRYPIAALCAHPVGDGEDCRGASLTAYLAPALVSEAAKEEP